MKSEIELEEAITDFLDSLTPDQQKEIAAKAKAKRIIHGAFYSQIPIDQPTQVCLTLAPLPDDVIDAGPPGDFQTSYVPTPYQWNSEKIARALSIDKPFPEYGTHLVSMAWRAWDSLSQRSRDSILKRVQAKD